MGSNLSRSILVSTLGVLALAACGERNTPTGPQESPSLEAAAALSYSAEDILGLGAEADSRATAINTAGHIVGYAFFPDDIFRVFIWKNGVVTGFGSSLGGSHARGFDINDGGQVVGSAENANGRMRAFRWASGTMRSLGTLGGNESAAFAINNGGDVVGESRLAGTTRRHAFLVRNGVMSDLGTLGGGNSSARDINDAGQVVGWSETATGIRHPFLWENGVMRDLLPSGSTSTGTAYAISPLGVVVGERNNRAFRWANGVFGGLGLANLGPSVATGIRGSRIVGQIGNQAFVLVGGELTLLPFLSNGVSSVASAVNGSGVVVGSTTKELDDSPGCNGGCAAFQIVTRWAPE